MAATPPTSIPSTLAPLSAADQKKYDAKKGQAEAKGSWRGLIDKSKVAAFDAHAADERRIVAEKALIQTIPSDASLSSRAGLAGVVTPVAPVAPAPLPLAPLSPVLQNIYDTRKAEAQAKGGWTGMVHSSQVAAFDAQMAEEKRVADEAALATLTLDDPALGSRTSGWSPVTPLPSVTGPVNALAQNNVPAALMTTTPATLYDASLGSRQYKNPNTGIRDPVASGSVYAMSNVPAYLSQTVAALNEEQALKRSLQAEWNNRLLQGVGGAGPNSYLYAEALRAASVSPGASVSFGQRISDPQTGRAQAQNAATQAQVEADRRRAFQELESVRKQMAITPPGTPEYMNLWQRSRQLAPAGSYVARVGGSGGGYSSGFSGGGWSSRPPVNSFQPGYSQYWGIGT